MQIMPDFISMMRSLEQSAQYPSDMEDAIIGIASRQGTFCFVMSRERCMDHLKSANDWDDLEAQEWMDYNVEGSFVGADTPYFVDENWGGA